MTERERFEAEYRKRSDRDDDDVEESLRLGKDGEYIYGGTWTAFYWWQAARAESTKIPEGMALVPVTPTLKMIEAAIYHAMRETDEDKYRAIGMIRCVWDEMLAATKDQQCPN